MKPCKKCGSIERSKPNLQHRYGRCKACNKGYLSTWRATNPDKVKAWGDAWRANNREKCNATQAKARKRNPDMARSRTRSWQKANPNKLNAYATKRKATKLQAIPKWFCELDNLIMQEAAKLCKMRENVTGFKWHPDHIVPLKSSLVCGFHIGYNIRVIPAIHNLSKGNRHWPDMP